MNRKRNIRVFCLGRTCDLNDTFTVADGGDAWTFEFGVSSVPPGYHGLVLLDYQGCNRWRYAHPKRTRILVLMEPKSSHYYVQTPQALDEFALVLTHDARLVGMRDHVRFFPFGTNWLSWPREPLTEIAKTRMTSCLAALHPDAPAGSGHHFRNHVVELLRGRGDVDCFGKGVCWADNVRDTLVDYRFSVVMENCRQDIYFSEKLINCLLTRTIPIYYGCDRIGDVFDTRGMLLFTNMNELEEHLQGLSVQKYEQLSPYNDENRQRAIHNQWVTRQGYFERLRSTSCGLLNAGNPVVCRPRLIHIVTKLKVQRLTRRFRWFQ